MIAFSALNWLSNSKKNLLTNLPPLGVAVVGLPLINRFERPADAELEESLLHLAEVEVGLPRLRLLPELVHLDVAVGVEAAVGLMGVALLAGVAGAVHIIVVGARILVVAVIVDWVLLVVHKGVLSVLAGLLIIHHNPGMLHLHDLIQLLHEIIVLLLKSDVNLEV